MSRDYRRSQDVPTEVLVKWLRELAYVVSLGRERMRGEFTMRIPAEVDRDVDLVLVECARRLESAATDDDVRIPT